MSRLFILLLCGYALALALASEETTEEPGHEDEGEEGEPADAVIFPSFSITIGVCVFYILTRYAHQLPYTAVMFLLGTLMGIGSELLDSNDLLNNSIRLWTSIDSEVLLLVFLPGLIFKDAMGLNVHLFRVSLVQSLIFAFPMVLAGTSLTALIAFYVFPYNWSFNLSMTFGSILSATDPVAVAALLNEVGAPPRLKVHISGEALLNDGAAIVFYGIFVERFLAELELPGVGEEIDFGRGVALFFRKALGGVAIGIFFGLGILFVLFFLNRRFSREENVVEVTSTLGLVYVGYFVSDFAWATSGVISTVTSGIIVKLMGRAMINDAKLMEDFWTLTEHLLNTILFTLGGAVWGHILSEEDGLFEARDWGYLILLYLLLMVIRFFLFFSVYPITKRIGLSTSLKETFFHSYSGLRGAVGIALALALDNEVEKETEEAEGDVDTTFRQQTRKLFGMVGGIAFLTLVINASTAKPLLRYLRLTESSEYRDKIVKAYRARFRINSIQKMVQLLTHRRFRNVNFEIVKAHVPYLSTLTKAQLLEAVQRHKEITPPENYRPPQVAGILPHLAEDAVDEEEQAHRTPPLEGEDILTSLDTVERKIRHEQRTKIRHQRRRAKSTMRYMLEGEPISSSEFRGLFISILRAGYDEQIANGELEDRHFLSISLTQSLDLAYDAVQKGEPLRDWDFVNIVDAPVSSLNEMLKSKPVFLKCLEKCFIPGDRASWKRKAKRLKIERSLAFMAAHYWAQEFFIREFENADSELSEPGKLVLSESQNEHKKAEEVLKKFDVREVEKVATHKFCAILLNHAVSYIEKLVKSGLLKDDEAEHWVGEIEKDLEGVHKCDTDHTDEVLRPIEEDHHLRNTMFTRK